MAALSGAVTLTLQDIYSSSSTVPGAQQVGQLGVTPEGKMFRYALAGGSSLTVGDLLQASANDTQFIAMAVPATQAIASAGTVQNVQVTNGTTTVTVHQFDGGSVVVDTTPDGGSEYTIVGHDNKSVTSGGTLNLVLDHPLQTAWTSSTKVTMKRSPWSGVIQFPATTQTGIPVGVAVYALTNATYGWVQTHGPCAVLSDGQTFAVGSEVGTPSGTAGSVTVFAAGTTHTAVGYTQQAQSNGHWISVFLQID
jgi:hypothetical protein